MPHLDASMEQPLESPFVLCFNGLPYRMEKGCMALERRNQSLGEDYEQGEGRQLKKILKRPIQDERVIGLMSSD